VKGTERSLSSYGHRSVSAVLRLSDPTPTF
jgi:hypothetical protein